MTGMDMGGLEETEPLGGEAEARRPLLRGESFRGRAVV